MGLRERTYRKKTWSKFKSKKISTYFHSTKTLFAHINDVRERYLHY